MFFRFFRWLNDVYPVTVFFFYIGLFFIAFMLAFFIPAAAALVLFGAIFALLPFTFANGVFKMAQRAIARAAVTRGVCPACKATLAERRCGACSIEFDPKGALVIPE
jgi:hypothetical protein